VEREKYLNLFVEESKENLLALNESLLELEKNPGEKSKLDNIFRISHTLKGMSATMGFDDITSLTHEMENLLDFLKTGRLKVDPEIIDILFLCLDSLETLVENLILPHPAFVDLTNLMYRLKKSLNLEPGSDKTGQNPLLIPDYNENEKNVILEAIRNKFHCFEIYVSLMENTMMKGLRAKMVLDTLGKLDSQVIRSIPPGANMINGEFADHFVLTVISTKEADQIKKEILSISEIKQAEVLEIPGTYFTHPAFPQNPLNLNTELPEFNDYEKLLVQEAVNANKRVILIGIRLLPGTIMKFARYVLVTKKLEGLGEIIKTIPDLPEIESENFQEFFQIVFSTNQKDNVLTSSISTVAELSDIVDLLPLDPKENPDLPKKKEESEIALQVPLNNEIAYDEDIIFSMLESLSPLDFTGNENSGAKNENNLAPVVLNFSPASGNEFAKADEKKAKTKKQTIRVDIERLNELINLVEELVMVKSRLNRLGTGLNSSELMQAVHSLTLLSGNLQNNAMRLRMVPVEHIFSRFPRMIRDLSKSLNKEINFVIEGEDTELDRTIIDEIGEPLVHLLRNAADHGLEPPTERLSAGKERTGNISLIARHEGNNVLIIVEDDGAGISIDKIKQKAIDKNIITPLLAETITKDEALNFLFLPGFTTAENVNDLSGRGVGLDAVKAKVDSIGGRINIYSEEGTCTRFTIKLPLTLAIMEVLLTGTGSEYYAVPVTYIEEVREIARSEIKNIHKTPVIIVRDKTIPLISLAEVLQVQSPVVSLNSAGHEEDEAIPVIIVRTEEGKKTSGIIVDHIIGQEDVVIKSLNGLARDRMNYISGTAGLGDGKLALILNITSLT
jgi:two-component system chemotaxis sensor kinase CheA